MSIYESNSVDRTKTYLGTLNTTLSNLHIDHRIIMGEDDRRWWPYGTSPERIQYLAQARNKVLEPLQSVDPAVRLVDYQEFDKLIFINDVLFQWEDIVRLIATKVRKDDNGDGNEEGKRERDDEYADEYDMACGTDFGTSGRSHGYEYDAQSLTRRAVRHVGRSGHLRCTAPPFLALHRRPGLG